MKKGFVGTILWACITFEAAFAQAPARVDFRNDVLPMLKQHCIGCHGPTQQMNGFRLDRRESAMRGGTGTVIVPANSAVSRLYLKLAGDRFGMQMPPPGPLSAEQIRIFKDWIDQGAEWPDDLAGAVPAAPPDPGATRVMEALRSGDRRLFRKLLAQDPKVVNLKGWGGATPLMYAALYGDPDSVKLLLASGAEPNLRNSDGATALMWAVHDPTKTRLLLDRGAEVDARSDDGRTPLLIATGRPGSLAVVKQLLDHGANPSAKAADGATTLQQAAQAGSYDVLRLLIERGANPKSAGPVALLSAMWSRCSKCADLLLQSADQVRLDAALAFLGSFGDVATVRTLLEHGANPNAKGFEGASVLLRSAHSDVASVDVMRALMDRGAELNAKSLRGDSALDFARLRGQTPVVDFLVKAGVKAGNSFSESPQPSPAGSARAAVQKSLPLLQSSDVTFARKSGCISCHHNNLTAMTVSIARKNQLPIDETIARQQLKAIGTYLDQWRERVLRGLGIPGDSDTVSYILVGLAAENYPPDAATDAMAHFLKTQQAVDGRWLILIHRPPIESSDITVTATSLRALRVYAPRAQRAEYQRAVQLAADWLTKARPKTNEERAFQLLGLGWAGTGKDAIEKAARELLAQQRSDGSWSQISTLPGDAYATGQALVALREAAGLPVTDPAYQRGVRFLLNTQLGDGSWFVRSRSMPFQPFFESGFPHGHDQWISAAASNWATMALAPAAR